MCIRDRGVEVVVATSGKPAIAYPNAGESWDADNHAWVGTSSYELVRPRARASLASGRRGTPRRLLPHRPGHHRRARGSGLLTRQKNVPIADHARLDQA